MPVPAAALDLIKKYEGFREGAYLCPAGKWTIGYGFTRVNGQPVKKGMVMTRQQADELLLKEADYVRIAIANNVKVRLNDNQLSALISFVFNLGIGALKSSTMLRKLSVKDYAGAAEEFPRWNKAVVNGRMTELPGLTRRRKEERELFLRV